MDTEQTADLLKKERERTDESLVTERGRSDESLSTLRNRAKQETDQQIKQDRKMADADRAESRMDRDVTRSTTVLDRDGEHTVIDGLVIEERRRNDGTMKAERNLMDAAMVKERASFETAVLESLRSERERTDENLSIEREQSDSEVTRNGILFVSEVKRHTQTKAALTTRDELLAIVSHDLRNPIGAIQSCASMLLEDSEPLTREKDLRVWMEFIKRNAETSLRLIGDLLDMERIAQGALSIEIKPQDLNLMIQECAQSFSYQAGAKAILLRALPSAVTELVSCDRDRIMQVLSNLMGNALKFTPEGGSVTIKLEQRFSETLISISDTGPGIPEDKLAHIFERFTQILNKDRRGLGLGLYISKTLMEAHKGSIAVTSIQGQGSTFTISLPRMAV